MSASTATCGSGAPPPAPEIEQDVDIWNPGGDPGELRRAAQAWRAMADTVDSVAGNLDGAVRRGLAWWGGPASARFAGQWDQVHTAMTVEVVPHLREIAGRLDETADAIEDINDQIHDLYVSIGVAVGAGVVLSVLTLGFSAAASAAAAAAAGARAGVLVARMASTLQAVAAALRAAKLAGNYSKAWGIAATVNTTATGISKAVTNPNHNPFSGWTLDDASAIVNGSTAAGLAGGAGTGLIRAGALGSAVGTTAAAHPLATAGTLGALSGSSGSLLNDFAGGEPLDWGRAGLGSAAGLGAGTASAGVARGIARLRLRPPSLSSASALPPALSRVDQVPAPAGFTRSPSGLYVPDDALPGFVRSPGGVITPQPAPAGWHPSPAGLVLPGPPPASTPAVVASGWDRLLGGLVTSAPAGGITKSVTARPRASQPAPVCAPAGP